MYVSSGLSRFYETEYEIWAGYAQVGRTKNFELGRFVCLFLTEEA